MEGWGLTLTLTPKSLRSLFETNKNLQYVWHSIGRMLFLQRVRLVSEVRVRYPVSRRVKVTLFALVGKLLSE